VLAKDLGREAATSILRSHGITDVTAEVLKELIELVSDRYASHHGPVYLGGEEGLGHPIGRKSSPRRRFSSVCTYAVHG
jgi:hypothetical protein